MANYDPNKRYTWDPKDTFELTGQDFGIILNSLRAILNTEEARKILMAQQASNTIEGILARNVESGVVKELAEEQKPDAPIE